jgi:hypothetical protein
MHSLRNLAHAVSALIVSTTVIACMTMVTLIVDDGGVAADIRHAQYWIARFVALAACACFIVWSYRARRNVDRLPGSQPYWPTGFTIGAWFIPLANLVLPCLVVADIARNSVDPRDTAGRRAMTALAAAWWSSAFVALMSYNIAYLNAERGVALDCLAIVMLLLSASVAVALVQRITTVQAKRATALELMRVYAR